MELIFYLQCLLTERRVRFDKVGYEGAAELGCTECMSPDAFGFGLLISNYVVRS